MLKGFRQFVFVYQPGTLVGSISRRTGLDKSGGFSYFSVDETLRWSRAGRGA